jgi:hypothetical protein
MSSEIAISKDAFAASVTRGAGASEAVSPAGYYVTECYDKDGNLKWSDYIKNVVTDTGRNHMLGVEFKSVTQVTAWYIGLISSVKGANNYATVANTDTQASHSNWGQCNGNNAPNYSQTSLRQVTFASAASKAIASSNAAVFSITGSGTVKGAFLTSNPNKSNAGVGPTTGTLYSAGLFSAGDKVVSNGDTLNVSYTTVLGG